MKQSDPELEWHTIHQEALDAVMDGIVANKDFQSTSYGQTTSFGWDKDASKEAKEAKDKKQGPKLLANGTCYHWNRGNCKKDNNCKWKHACNSCMGDHRVADCKKKDK